MVEVKVERRSSGRLVSKRIILSEDEDTKYFSGEIDENVKDNNNNSSKGSRKRFNDKIQSNRDDDETSESEEFIPKSNSRRRLTTSDCSEDEENGSKRGRREKIEELRERRSGRNGNGRLRESERLLSDFIERDDQTRKSSRDAKSKMEEEDAALAAAISAGYFSDDERELEHVRLRNGTRFKGTLDQPSSISTMPAYNPYARNGLGSYSGPMRRSGRTAAVVSAARVAMYSSMLNPDSSINHEDNSIIQNKYNLRPNRPSGTEAPYYEYQPERSVLADTSERLFEEDDVDGHNNPNNNNDSGEVSLEALDKIAGMDGYVKKLKEMIVFPLIYPHLFEKLNISLPRGVLFHGPPGTGKTLMARLLASACSTSTRKVSFFMRNGSDCLSKWIGEAERNMRLLFKKAKECQPSIIFFDEIDGLAPERTGRQDQSHISLVSTLLALMDGLDDRGQVVVIGATNRIHSIDAALRRPGRFDREFFFGLPDESARAQILKIQTKTWEPEIEDSLANDLATRTSGYSGADMKALCVEAALRAVQRTYPEVYESATKITGEEFENTRNDVVVNASDFEHALIHLTPSNRRHVSQYDLVSLQKPQAFLYSRQFSEIRDGLISKNLKKSIVMEASGKVTWQLLEPLVIKVLFDGSVHPESFVWRFVCGLGDLLDGFSVQPVDLLTLRDDSCGLSGALWRGLNDARLKGGAFCILFKSFEGLSRDERKEMIKILKRFIGSLVPGEPVIIIFTCKNGKRNSCDNLNEEGSLIRKFRLKCPENEQIEEYFNFILRSIHRLISSDHLILLSELEFVTKFKKPENLTNVRSIERFRMEIGDLVRSDLEGFCEKYFDCQVIKKSAEIVNKTEIIDNSNENVIDNSNENLIDNSNENLTDNSNDNVIDNSIEHLILNNCIENTNEFSDDPENVLFKQ